LWYLLKNLFFHYWIFAKIERTQDILALLLDHLKNTLALAEKCAHSPTLAGEVFTLDIKNLIEHNFTSFVVALK